jgi:hypothetical protein
MAGSGDVKWPPLTPFREIVERPAEVTRVGEEERRAAESCRNGSQEAEEPERTWRSGRPNSGCCSQIAPRASWSGRGRASSRSIAPVLRRNGIRVRRPVR